MVDVIGVLKSQERFAADAARAEGRAAPSGANWLSSHPSNDQRLADIVDIAAGYKGDYADDGRTRYLQAIDGIGFGESRAQGVTRGRNFFHEELGIALTAPQGWQLQNEQQAITLVNGAGDAGLIVQLIPAKAGSTHDEIIRNLIKPTEGRVERRTLNGLAATQFAGTRRNAQGQSQAVRVLLVTGPVRPPLPALPSGEGRRGTAARRGTAGRGRSVVPPAQRRRPRRRAAWVLKTVPFPRGGFAELARSSPLTLQAEAQLRLLNGAYAGAAEPRLGQPVKVVR